ncbi:hypothetical protein [Shewanella atlantica]|uniref:DUF3379 domain-containing protein n=1 Tax=Shewanella atlantica TaxID=271099 RepID=A0A431VWZ8_9GAMM|nr:hypothetical protein [Shewanella atlantica]RTR27655.1 hypothetical protein EKG39_19795 [Shewanella atlantica]
MKMNTEQMNTSFKQSAKQFIEQQHLDNEQLAKFESLLSDHMGEALPVEPSSISNSKAQAADISNSKVRFRSYIALVASLILIVTMSLNYYPQGPAISLMIADEVAMNHINMKPLEVDSQRIEPIREYFTELNFSVVKSSLFSKQNYQMLGGRYCSIQGVSAAQIRYQTDSGNKVTLYEVGYDAELYGKLPHFESGEPALEVYVKGIRVLLWVEKGLLMAEAQSID